MTNLEQKITDFRKEILEKLEVAYDLIRKINYTLHERDFESLFKSNVDLELRSIIHDLINMI